jgi:hypothetical protein
MLANRHGREDDLANMTPDNGNAISPETWRSAGKSVWQDDASQQKGHPLAEGKNRCQRVNAMGKLSAKIKEEIEALLPPTIFFFVALHIVALVRALMVRGTGLAPLSLGAVTLAAIILGKAVLIADLLPFINRYPEKPLIYNTVWKTVIYTLVALLIHYLERLVDFWRQTGSIVAGNRKLFDEIIWAHVLAVQILLLVMVFCYCSIRELGRVIGRDKMLEMFFGFRLNKPADQVSVRKDHL